MNEVKLLLEAISYVIAWFTLVYYTAFFASRAFFKAMSKFKPETDINLYNYPTPLSKQEEVQ